MNTIAPLNVGDRSAGRPAGKRVMAKYRRLGERYDLTMEDCEQNADDLGFPVWSGNWVREVVAQLENLADAGEARSTRRGGGL